MTHGPKQGRPGQTWPDQEIDRSLSRIANERLAVSSGFASRLAQMAEHVPQQPRPRLARLVQAFGGWGLAVPQIAGLAVAAYLGVLFGEAQTRPLPEDDMAVMTAHLFGAPEAQEWLQ